MQIDVNQRTERRLDEGVNRLNNRVSSLPSRSLRRVSPDLFLWSAGGSLLLSAALRLMGRRDDAVFVGEWVPTMLLLGIYNRVHRLGEQRGI